MASLTVSEACTRCGLCARTCPWRIVEAPRGGVPRFRENAAPRCNLCGHCESVCPAAAIEVTAPHLPPSEREGKGGDGWRGMDPDLLARHLRMRRSIRSYRPDPVDRGTLETMLDIVRFAPTGRNRQNVHWLVIHDTKRLRRLTRLAMEWLRDSGQGTPVAARFDVPGMVRAWEEGRDPLCQHAPHLVIAHAGTADPVANVNAIIALAHLDLLAPAFGVGTCWGGIFMLALQSCQRLQSALRLPPGHMPVHCLMLGYPSVSYRRPPKRNPASVAWR